MYVRANKHRGTLFTVYIFERGRGHRWQVYADSSYFSPSPFPELAEKLIPYFKLFRAQGVDCYFPMRCIWIVIINSSRLSNRFLNLWILYIPLYIPLSASIKLAGSEFFFFFFYEIWKFSFIDFVILSLKRALYCASTWTVVCNNFGRNLKWDSLLKTL